MTVGDLKANLSRFPDSWELTFNTEERVNYSVLSISLLNNNSFTYTPSNEKNYLVEDTTVGKIYVNVKEAE